MVEVKTLEELKQLTTFELRSYILAYIKDFKNINLTNEAICYILESVDELNNGFDVYEEETNGNFENILELINTDEFMENILDNDNVELIKMIDNNSLDYCLRLAKDSLFKRKVKIFTHCMLGLYPLKQYEAEFILRGIDIPINFCEEDIYYLINKSKDYGY